MATADVDLFSSFLEQGVDPDVCDKVSSVVIMIAAVVMTTLLIVCSVVYILCSMPFTREERTWWSY